MKGCFDTFLVGSDRVRSSQVGSGRVRSDCVDSDNRAELGNNLLLIGYDSKPKSGYQIGYDRNLPLIGYDIKLTSDWS